MLAKKTGSLRSLAQTGAVSQRPLEAPDSDPPCLPNNPSIWDRETSSNGCNRARGNADAVSWGVRKEALRVVIPKNREYLRREKVRVSGPTQQSEFNPFTQNVNGIIREKGQKSSRIRSGLSKEARDEPLRSAKLATYCKISRSRINGFAYSSQLRPSTVAVCLPVTPSTSGPSLTITSRISRSRSGSNKSGGGLIPLST